MRGGKLFHVVFGLLVVVAFLLTGQYMDRFHEHLRGMPDGPRMLYRSRHIYILLAGLLNLSLGTYLQPRPARLARALQVLGSALIVAATCMLVAAFFREPPLADLQHTPLSYWGLHAIFSGTLLHLLGGVGRHRRAGDWTADAGRGGRRDES